MPAASRGSSCAFCSRTLTASFGNRCPEPNNPLAPNPSSPPLASFNHRLVDQVELEALYLQVSAAFEPSLLSLSLPPLLPFPGSKASNPTSLFSVQVAVDASRPRRRHYLGCVSAVPWAIGQREESSRRAHFCGLFWSVGGRASASPHLQLPPLLAVLRPRPRRGHQFFGPCEWALGPGQGHPGRAHCP